MTKKRTSVIDFSGAEGCGLNFAYTLDQNDMPFCTPCQTVQFSCPGDNKINEKDICPISELNGSDKTAFQATTEANTRISDLFDRNCIIHTHGWFYDTLGDWKKSGEAWTRQRIEEALNPYLEKLVVEERGKQYIGTVEVRIRNLDGSPRLFDTIQFDAQTCSLEDLKRKWMEEAFITVFTMRLRVLPPNL